MSAANATTASTAPTSVGTTTTTTTHKRAASQLKADSQIPGPSVIHLFVKNVRLLDLDLLPDWPVLTPTSLSNQDARVRIRGTEWCLYQLFKKYDPSTTADKLQPFFPPLEPLQSINLRAALYRCLNELKKNGVLGRDVVLRKSMLDDCQGDKFWELCLSFSAIVLRKVHIDRRNDQGKPVAERIGAAPTLTKSSRESMLPLSIAHRAALTKVLQEKERKRDTFTRLYDVLVQKDASLQRRKARVDRNTKHTSLNAASRADRVKVAQDVLDNQWVGSTELQAALIYGGDATGGDALLKTPFDDIWEANQQGRLHALNTSEANVLDDLDARARQQRRRLERWQNFHAKLLQSKPAPAATTAAVPKRDMPLCFDRHQNLSIHDMEDMPRSPAEPQPLERIAALAKYDEILTAMREELRRNVEPGRAPTREAVSDARRQAQRPAPVSTHEMSPSPTDGHRRSPSQTAVPMRPLLGRRTSTARSRSYNQPKVISQRELVPLKSELFSPLKGNKRMSGVYGTSSFRASPVDDALESNLDDILDATSERLRQGSADGSTTNPHDSGYGLGMVSSRASSASGSSSPRLSKASAGADTADSAIDVASTRSSLTRHPSDGKSSRPVPIRASLADRTRLSMAFRGAAALEGPYASAGANGYTAEPDSLPASPVAEDLPAPQTLMERTRQSISMAPPSAGPLRVAKNSNASHSRSRTSIVYPVNQFETPPSKATRRASLAAAAAGANGEDQDGGNAHQQVQNHHQLPRRDFTPREQLFAADAEYDSVFKARPKIALSPVLSPRDSGHGQMGDEENDASMAAAFGKLDPEEVVAAVGRESPLMR